MLTIQFVSIFYPGGGTNTVSEVARISIQLKRVAVARLVKGWTN
jgi:hypothetical protein